MAAKADKDDKIEEQDPTRQDIIAKMTEKIQQQLFKLHADLKEFDGKGLTMSEVEFMCACWK